MLFRSRLRFLFCAVLLGAQTLQSTVIIFDLGNVLFTTNRWTVAQEIGFWDLFIYKLKGGDPKADCFTFLEKAFGQQSPLNPSSPQEAWLYTTGDGIRLPHLWCEHMKGTRSGEKVIEQVETHLKKHKKNRKNRLISNFIRTVFNPKILADAMYPIAEGIRLVADCAKKTVNKIMVLSNFGADSFDELYKKPESRAIFDHVPHEHLMISGKMGLIKPDPAIYEEVKKRLVTMDERFQDPVFLAANCVFIDDQVENIIGARKAGITALSLEDGNYERIREELELLGAL